MSEILAVERFGMLRVRCAGCARIYVTSAARWNVQRQTKCQKCRPQNGGRTREGVVEAVKTYLDAR